MSPTSRAKINGTNGSVSEAFRWYESRCCRHTPSKQRTWGWKSASETGSGSNRGQICLTPDALWRVSPNMQAKFGQLNHISISIPINSSYSNLQQVVESISPHPNSGPVNHVIWFQQNHVHCKSCWFNLSFGWGGRQIEVRFAFLFHLCFWWIHPNCTSHPFQNQWQGTQKNHASVG